MDPLIQAYGLLAVIAMSTLLLVRNIALPKNALQSGVRVWHSWLTGLYVIPNRKKKDD